jgi:hypothetical protein
MADKLPIRLFKTKQLTSVTPEDAKMIVDFVKFAASFLKFDGPYNIRLVHAAPDEPITTGCYAPAEKKISTIVEGRHFLDYCRTIAHEMVHQRQHETGEFEEAGEIPEIGGKIEDDANSIAGQIMKSYIKKHLKPEQKKSLGLGTY